MSSDSMAHNSSKEGKLNFIADHMPPTSIGKRMTESFQYRFYPHCGKCSSRQGGILGSASSRLGEAMPKDLKALALQQAGGGKKHAHFHGLRFRMNHLSGGVIAANEIIGARENTNLSKRKWADRGRVQWVKGVPLPLPVRLVGSVAVLLRACFG